MVSYQSLNLSLENKMREYMNVSGLAYHMAWANHTRRNDSTLSQLQRDILWRRMSESYRKEWPLAATEWHSCLVKEVEEWASAE